MLHPGYWSDFSKLYLILISLNFALHLKTFEIKFYAFKVQKIPPIASGGRSDYGATDTWDTRL